MSKPGSGRGPLRDWAASSYSQTGRAAKSSMPAQESYGADGVVKGWSVTNQIGEARNAGQGGAPGIEAMDKSGSGDRGRRKYNRDGGSDGGGRADGTNPSGRH